MLIFLALPKSAYFLGDFYAEAGKKQLLSHGGSRKNSNTP
jgi:hypothetical protein